MNSIARVFLFLGALFVCMFASIIFLLIWCLQEIIEALEKFCVGFDLLFHGFVKRLAELLDEATNI